MVRSRESGFTIIEILFALTILAIMASLAAPSFRDFVAGQRIRAASYDVSSALMLARSEAVKRNATVVLSPQGGNWANGWALVAGAATLARHEAFSDLAIDGPASDITYTASGRVSAPVTRFAISSAAASTAPRRCIRVELTGMASVYTGSACT
jgi:type IV fimbrial biogenesis protein FimT